MLVDGNGNDIGSGDLGWAPLAALAPIGLNIAKATGSALVKKIQGSPPPPPPCTFFQRLGKVFGSKPPCR